MLRHVTIIGAGVAGLTAAIAARLAGMEATLLERQPKLCDQPGETLHPGLEPLFEQLGVAEAVASVAAIRHRGIVTRRDGVITRSPYGETDGIPWRGFQIDRHALKRVLLKRATGLGAECIFSCGRLEIEGSGRAGLSLLNNGRRTTTDWIIDATGPYAWSKRFDGVSFDRATQPISVCYGYNPQGSTCIDHEWPELDCNSRNWVWRAKIGEEKLAWVAGCHSRKAFERMRLRAQGTADGTWCLSQRPACDRVYRIGDAAFRMDPSTGKGVLRATMSAMMAIHFIGSVNGSAKAANEAGLIYSNWISDWFYSDLREIRGRGLLENNSI